MPKENPWFFEERAVAFASLVLTAHNEVRVQPYAGRDIAIDLLVEILRHGRPTLRFFGVQIVPYMDLPNVQSADERTLLHLGRDPFEASLPLCVFVIGVRKPEGIYRWVVEPVVEDGRAVLRPSEAATWQTLDEAGAARLIGQVNAWSDALGGNSLPKTHGRRSKTGS
jgi:hypothetical protein